MSRADGGSNEVAALGDIDQNRSVDWRDEGSIVEERRGEEGLGTVSVGCSLGRVGCK